jgi:hypothetical protein
MGSAAYVCGTGGGVYRIANEVLVVFPENHSKSELQTRGFIVVVGCIQGLKSR